MSGKRNTIIGLGILILTIFASIFFPFYTKLLWFRSVGFTPVFWTIFLTKAIVSVCFGALFLVIMGTNLYIARRLGERTRGMGPHLLEELAQAPISPKDIDRMLIFIAIALSIGSGFLGLLQWDIVLKFLYQEPFGGTDPIFQLDIGYYVFSLPLYRFIRNWLFSCFIITSATVVLLYLNDNAIRLIGSRSIEIVPRVRTHIFILGAILLLVLAWSYRLSMFNLLHTPRGIIFGAAYTDSNVKLFAYHILIWASLACALIFLANIWLNNMRLALFGISAIFVISAVLGGIVPELIQQFIVKPTELAKEKPYLAYSIDFTSRAYNLDKIEERDFPASETLTADAIARNEQTIDNIRLWDPRPIKDTYGQLQEIRLYYNFPGVDIDRYWFDGHYRQTFISGRELAVSQLPEAARTWVNEHVIYTHGYGVVMSPVTRITDDGLPELIIKDIPPVSSVNIEITRPEIYYGEEALDYAFVKTREREFDYPKGDKNEYTTYQGQGGVQIDSLLKRLAFTWQFRAPNIFFSTYITSESRILFNRRIAQMNRLVAPFLKYDSDPYLVISEGKLFWIQDAYTTTDMYPYSQRYSNQPGRNFNYIRNSAKIVIDAYDGMMTLYLADPSDPIIKTYARIFPGLFQPFEAMPQSLKAHIRYPSDFFTIQATMYATYHMKDPEVFYNREDLWAFPREKYAGEERVMEPYYVIMKPPGQPKEEFILMLPFTPSNKHNMIAWLAARSDFPDYGKLLVYKFPKQKLIFGPMQIEARIDQDPNISREITLWSQEGSRVIRGNLFVIPIEDSFVYVEPLYLIATSTKLPQLQRVIVVSGDRVAMEPNLETSLNAVFGTAKKKEVKEVAKEAVVEVVQDNRSKESLPLQQLATGAIEAFLKAKDYLKEANWAKYGEEFEKIGRLLQDLAKAVGESPQ